MTHTGNESISHRCASELIDLNKFFVVNLMLNRLTVGVDLLNKFLEDFLVEWLPHHSQDISHEVTGDTTRAVVVEAVEGFAED